MNHTLRAIARTVVPETASLTGTEWDELATIIASALAQRPARVRRQVALLVTAINLLPMVRYGRRFTSLAPEKQLAFLRSLESSPVLLLRRGVWGLRTLIFMGYYGRPSAGAAIGYRADPRGWAARR